MLSLADVVSRLVPLLNAASTADLIWWTVTELQQYAAEALQRIAQRGSFVESIEVTSYPGTVPLPDDAIAPVHVALDGVSLRPVTMRDLAALSSTWTTDTGTPSRFVLQGQGLRTLRVYPQPAPASLPTAATLALVYRAAPLTDTHRAPAVIADCLVYAALAEARKKRGDGEMQDAAKAARERAALLEDVIKQTWGS